MKKETVADQASLQIQKFRPKLKEPKKSYSYDEELGGLFECPPKPTAKCLT